MSAADIILLEKIKNGKEYYKKYKEEYNLRDIAEVRKIYNDLISRQEELLDYCYDEVGTKENILKGVAGEKSAYNFYFLSILGISTYPFFYYLLNTFLGVLYLFISYQRTGVCPFNFSALWNVPP